MMVRSFALLALLGLAVPSCQSPDLPLTDYHNIATKTGFTTWEIADVTRKKTLQCMVWYPIDVKTPAQPVVDSLFRRVPAAVDAPLKPSEHKYPLILLSAGIGGTPDSLAWLAQVLVANGYIVAAVRHDDTALDGTPDINLWNRPLDISELLTSLESSTWGPLIDPNRIGMAGFAEGGLVGVWLAGGVAADVRLADLLPHKEDANPDSFRGGEALLKATDIAKWKQSYRDPRIHAYFLMAPSWAWIFQEKDLKKIITDTFIVVGDDDQEINAARNAVHYAQWIPQAEFKEIQGRTGHWEFMGEWTSQGLDAVRARLPKDAVPTLPLEHRRRRLHQELGHLVIDFFNHALPAKQ